MSPQAEVERKGANSNRPAARALSGATILQLVPALRDDPASHAAIDIALTLLQAGARAIVAGEGGPLVGELRAFGGEWLPMPNDTFNPLRIRGNARALAQLIAAERIDVVHAHSAGAAWSALLATDRMPVFLVTSLADRLAGDSWPGTALRASLSRGDRVIAPSSFVSRATIERYAIAPERVCVIPRAVDTATFSPAAVTVERIAGLRRAWGVLPHMRVVLVPGPIMQRNGQMTVIEAARLIVGGGERNIVIVFAGDDRTEPRTTSALRRRARYHRIDTLCRFVGACADMPGALAAADVVLLPALAPPLSGHTAAQAQAMGRPVVVSSLGVLPENMLCPPRMPEDLRTGWLVRPGNVAELARATSAALALDRTAYEALGARARQFAEFMFSPPNVAQAIRAVYTSLLARDA
jgi:glycosyltransferase involved in cell wall biosynthesis